MKKIVIYGTGKLAHIIYTLIKDDGRFDIASFSADKQYIDSDNFYEYPLICFDKIEEKFSPTDFNMLVLGGYNSPRARKEMFLQAKRKGYEMINYVASNAFVSKETVMGENNVVFGGCYIDAFGKLGNNNIIRPNVYIGHDFAIEDHNYIAPGCNIAGYSKIKNLCFVGIGTTIIERITLEEETFIGAHSLIIENTEGYSKYVGVPAKKISEHKESGIIIG